MRLKQLIYNQLLTIQYVIGQTKKYHPGKRKSMLRKLWDLLAWQIKEGDFNTMYYAMGIDQNGSVQSDYIGRKSFLKIKEKVEYKLRCNAGCIGLEYEVVTKDKFYANSILMANGIPCIKNIALITGTSLIFSDGKEEGIETILTFRDFFFIKSIAIEAGEDVLKCMIINDGVEVNCKLNEWESFKALLGNKKWVVQKQYYSHKVLRKINSSALNTTRIVTIFNGKEPEYLCGFQCFATGNATIDSWSHGSVYAGIDIDKGCLREHAITSVSDQRPGQLLYHPDSGINFKDFEIPYLKEAVVLCIRAHRLLYFNFIIGWDVAITDTGPLIVEANEKPGMNVAQALNGGLRQKIVEYAAKAVEE